MDELYAQLGRLVWELGKKQVEVQAIRTEIAQVDAQIKKKEQEDATHPSG